MDTPPYRPEGAAEFKAPGNKETAESHPSALGGFTPGDIVEGKKIIAFSKDADGREVAVLLGPSESDPRKTGIKRVPIEELSQRHIDQAGGFKVGDRVKTAIGGKDGEYEIQGLTIIDGRMKALVGSASEEGRTHEVNADWKNLEDLRNSSLTN